MSAGAGILTIILAAIIGVPLAIAAVVYLIVPVGKAIFWIFKQLFVFIGSTIADVIRLVGAVLTGLVLVPLTIVNVVLGRWSASSHYGRAIESEVKNAGASVYRLVIGNPARLLCLQGLTEGIEKRIPQIVAQSPGSDKPGRAHGRFDGYTIIGSLPGGGSGSKLYVATPSAEKLAGFVRNGQTGVDKVVIKSFSIAEGSTLSGVLRENRALPAARRLGLILEHESAEDRFFYVMRYVPGDSLGVVTQRLHALGGSGGLGNTEIRETVEYAADLLRTLCHYHVGGLWHKDVKPDNIIISDGQAHLVDFGLVTPLRSSMTLTTHGTEYFRDPEMVRMALRGVKVHEVDGAKFDIYAAGAVLYSMIENSFPAHGGLSQISRRCPDALRWVVRRAMTEYDKRYEAASVMLTDLETIAAAPDPFMLRPADLPSMRGGAPAMTPGFDAEVPMMPPPIPQQFQPPPIPVEPGTPAAGGRMATLFAQVGHAVDNTLAAAGVGAAAARAGFPVDVDRDGRPHLRVASWWTGKYHVHTPIPIRKVPITPLKFSESFDMRGAPGVGVGARARGTASRIPGASAADQLARARNRARQARSRAQARLAGRRRDYPAGVNAGVVAAFFLFLAACVVLVGGILGFALFSRTPGVEISTSEDGSNQITFGGVSISTVPPATPEPPAKPVDWSPGARSMPAAPPSVVSDTDILIVRDAITFEPVRQAGIDQQVLALHEAGFNLLGDVTLEGLSHEGITEQNELVAQVRSKVGITPVTEPAAGELIREFLSEHAELDLVVWYGRGDDGNSIVAIYGRNGINAETVKKASDAMSGGAPARTRKR